MKSRSTSTRKNRLRAGFTLVEIMIAVAIFTMLLGFGLIVGMDFYRSYSFNSERNISLAVLRKARTEAMVNIDQAAHGVHITATQYTIFEGAAFTGRPAAQVALDETIKAQPTITLTPVDIVFNQLDGSVTTPGSFTVSDGARLSTVLINNEGRIDW